MRSEEVVETHIGSDVVETHIGSEVVETHIRSVVRSEEVENHIRNLVKVHTKSVVLGIHMRNEDRVEQDSIQESVDINK
jgi:hypothetical protein